MSLRSLLNKSVKGNSSIDDTMRLNGCLEMAKSILAETDFATVKGVHPIFNYIDVLLSRVRTEIIIRVGYEEHTDKLRETLDGISRDFGQLVQSYRDSQRYEHYEPLFGIYGLKDKGYLISLVQIPSLSLPWKISRFVDAIAGIGKNVSNPFEYDPLNHWASLIFPIGVTLVENGNHSSAVGIIKHEGEVMAKQVYDLTPVYKILRFDGTNYVSTQTNKVLHTPEFKELGIIFEIGRLIYTSENKDSILGTVYPKTTLDEIESQQQAIEKM